MRFRRPRRPTLVGIVAGAALVAGCQPGVREDRTIGLGPDGRAAFQHGRNGVFVTDPATGKPRRVYEPGPDDLAVGPPAWDPAGRRMAFAVARPADGTRTAPPGEGPADGRRYAAVPVRYTCWLYDPSAAGGAPERLFEAACGHPGYVAAGLAVAWHPDGRRLDFVDRSGPGRHQVRTFDLTARRSEPVPLPSAEHVCLGSATGQRHRSVLLGGAAGQSGLWVEGEAGGWWRVPDSEPEAAHLEELRRRLPRWSRDGRKLAFVAGTALRVCDTATRRTDQWLDAGDSPASAGLWWGDPHPSASLHWHPDGSRIGLVRGSRLGLVGPAGWLGELTDSPVVSFAGWDAGGRWAAYVTAEPLPYAADPPDSQAGPSDLLPAIAGAPWATLFVPNPAARSAVRFADADGKNPRVAVSGLRATFPHWSPTEPRLSVWLTVEPPYRLAAGGRFGMPPGDPAAVLDPDTGALDWLPVSGTEHAQIGHAELRAGRLAAALDRFDAAAAGLPPGGKADWMLFRAVALQRAGRDAEARDAWRRFEPPGVGAPDRPRDLTDLRVVATGPRPPLAGGDVLRPRHRFAAEAFVSLEMAAEGIDFFRREAVEARSDADRLSAAVGLCQLLLLADRRAEYARCVADELLPLAARLLPGAGAAREAVGGAVALTVLPLAAEEFAAAVPGEVIRRVGERVGAWPHGGDDADFACRLVMRACGRRLRDAAVVERAAARLAAHPARGRWELSAGGEVDRAALLRVRVAFLLQDLFRDALGADLTR